MDSVVILVLFVLLNAFVGDVAASCKKMANDDMLEYFCMGGHPADLTTIPETTEKLRITKMPLRRITADTFSRFGDNLWVLGCSHCEITDIEADAFLRHTNLQQLSLDNNYLTTVEASWFEGLDSLTYLDLNYNNIDEIEDDVYRNLPSLVDFRISGNRLQCLNLEAMSHLKELKRMFLSENSEFACPHAVSRFLENQGVTFEQDPEWRRLASDTIDVQVPPSHAEEDRRTIPAYRERLHPDRRPAPEEPEVPYAPVSGDRNFRPDYHADHRSRHRKPTSTMRPRVEPKYPIDIRISQESPESSSHQMVPYPYLTQETPQAPPMQLRPSEDIRNTGTEVPSQMEHTLTYPPYVPTHETMPYPSYPTSERARTPPMEWESSSEDSRMAGMDRSSEYSLTYDLPSYDLPYETTRMSYPSYPTSERSQTPYMEPPSENVWMAGTERQPQTEHILTNLPHVPMHETMPYPSYPTSERPRTLPMEWESSSENRKMEGPDRSSQGENIVTYPVYVTTSNSQERGSIQMLHPSSDSDMVTWSTEVPMRYPDDPSRMHDWERHEQSRHPIEENDRSSDLEGMPPHYVRQEPNEMIVDESKINDKAEQSQTMTTMPSDLHYIRPSHSSPPSYPELVHSPATDEFYQAPYYETTVTMHPPLRKDNLELPVLTASPLEPVETTTDKPLPDCPERSSSSRTRPDSILVMSIIVTILGHVIVEGF